MWGGLLWFLWGLSFPVGNWLQIDTLKPTREGALVWMAFGAGAVLCQFMISCTEAVLARIDEVRGIEPTERGS